MCSGGTGDGAGVTVTFHLLTLVLVQRWQGFPDFDAVRAEREAGKCEEKR